MAEIHRVSTPPAGKMTVTSDSARLTSSGGAVPKQLKKMPSEGLISLSPEPGRVKFESDALSRPSSGGSRSNSRTGGAGHVERKLELARKKEELLDETDVQMFTRHSSESNVTNQMSSLAIAKKPIPADQDGKTAAEKEETSSDSSESDSSTDESDTEDVATGGDKAKAMANGDESKVQTPVELKGDFLKAVMDEDFETAKGLCQKILLLEPDNATCIDFHSVITEKIKQDEEEGESSDDSDDSDDDEDSDDDDDDDADDDNDEESEEDSSEDDSDDDYTPPTGPINLIMGGLPILPQPR